MRLARNLTPQPTVLANSIASIEAGAIAAIILPRTRILITWERYYTNDAAVVIDAADCRARLSRIRDFGKSRWNGEYVSFTAESAIFAARSRNAEKHSACVLKEEEESVAADRLDRFPPSGPE